VVCIGHGGSCYNGGTRRPSAHISGYGDTGVNKKGAVNSSGDVLYLSLCS
jgi:hypothetical protein